MTMLIMRAEIGNSSDDISEVNRPFSVFLLYFNQRNSSEAAINHSSAAKLVAKPEKKKNSFSFLSSG